MATGVFAGFHVGAQIAYENGGGDFVIMLALFLRREFCRPVTAIGRTHFQDSRRCVRGVGGAFDTPVLPFLAIEHELGCVDIFGGPEFCVSLLAVGVLLSGQLVAPAEAIPIMNVESDGHEVSPETGGVS